MYRAGTVANVVITVFTISVAWGLRTVGHAQIPGDDRNSSLLTEDDRREERLIDGMNRGMKQDYRGAIAIFSALIQRYPDYADAYFNRGIARAKIQDYQGAIADQTRAIDLDPQLAEAYQARAQLYWQLGDRRRARQDLQTAVTLFASQRNAISQTEAESQLQQWQRP